MVIRECRESDFDMVLPLLRQLWPDRLLEMEVLRKVFQRALSQESIDYYCAEEEGIIVGFFSLSTRESLYRQGRLAYLDEMVVDEGHRGKGVGAALLRHAEKMARRSGCNCLALDTAAHRTAAHRFYEREGYVRTGFAYERELA